jgi:hypothetical protein
LTRFGVAPPTKTLNGTWHNLALELHGDGDKVSLYQAIRDHVSDAGYEVLYDGSIEPARDFMDDIIDKTSKAD